ncbi:hypothetical protein [Pseudoduganella violaceinigra]|uniref:hypothetical protein n=1 Tax=Pseudoduganella violaceinigra TaxID=246602 RepID=UPI00041175BB|nr:hypothetical protein [Pseudoduganella violaceinigra]
MGYHISILRAQTDPIRMEELAQAIARRAFEKDAQPAPQVDEPCKGQEGESMPFEDGMNWKPIALWTTAAIIAASAH